MKKEKIMKSSLEKAETATGVSRLLLRDRGWRRRFMLWQLVVLLLALVLGTWPLDEWLRGEIIRFLLWWAGVVFLLVWLSLMAIYDLSRIRAEALEEISKEFDELD